MDHPDPHVDRVARCVELDETAGDLDLALVRPVEAREDVHQGRLPGAVLPEERVDLPGRDLERHVLVRDDAREPLRDPAHCHGRPFRDGRGYLVRSGIHGAGPEGVSPAYPFGLPMTPLTSQVTERISGSVIRLPFGTRSLPAWSYSGPVNS